MDLSSRVLSRNRNRDQRITHICVRFFLLSFLSPPLFLFLLSLSLSLSHSLSFFLSLQPRPAHRHSMEKSPNLRSSESLHCLQIRHWSSLTFSSSPLLSPPLPLPLPLSLSSLFPSLSLFLSFSLSVSWGQPTITVWKNRPFSDLLVI